MIFKILAKNRLLEGPLQRQILGGQDPRVP